VTDLFKIKAMSAPWEGLNYSVSWDGRGIVSKEQQLKKIWDAAFDSCTKGYKVGFSFERGEAIRIDSSVAYGDQYSSVEYLVHLVHKHGGINGVAFVYRDEAELFVDAMEKHISWNLLKRDFNG
jgi:hypothetical protein